MESRPLFVVCVCKGPVRASLLTFVALAQLVLATDKASFGLPKYRSDVHPITNIALKKRLMEKVIRRMQLVGDPLQAEEAQRPETCQFCLFFFLKI